MQPMVITSTRFTTFEEIKVGDIDLFDDAWGFQSEFSDVTTLLKQLRSIKPEKRLTKQLLDKVKRIK